ncbi:MAG TPA: hypothetical protein PKA37_01925 [Planctomycetota bacterium]|nr:hypothetical protein [Planctomycetota bacterium]
MLLQGRGVSAQALEQLVLEMDAMSHERDVRIRAWLQSTVERRAEAHGRCQAEKDAAGSCALWLRESVLKSLALDVGDAMLLARRALEAAGSDAPSSLKALILTQVAACARSTGDLRGALQ